MKLFGRIVSTGTVKRLTALLVCAVIAFTMRAVQSSAGIMLLCDVNSDSAVNAKDVLRLKQYLAQWEVVIDADCSDCNRDKSVNAKDLLIIRQALANIIPTPTFPEITAPSLPEDYPAAMLGCSVNQVGYSTNAQKVARVLFADTGNKTAVCYLVNADTKGVVYSSTTPRKHFDSTMDGYVSDFDFSHITAEGSYYVATPRGVSATFKIADNPYVDVQNALITALYYNRCGCALDSAIVGDSYAHAECHTGDNPVTVLNLFDSVLGKYKDNGVHQTADEFSGGLHDAGDYGRYVVPGNQVVASCIYATELFNSGVQCNIITDKKGESIPDTLDQARYEMEWILKMQNPQNGGVYYRLAFKSFADAQSWAEPPDTDSKYEKFGLFCSREHLKSTAGAVGNAAACYYTFKNIDLEFANRCLAAAKRGYAYVKANMNDKSAHTAYSQSSEYEGGIAGEYGSGSSWNEIWYAAGALYRATGENAYLADANDLIRRRNAGEIAIGYSGINGYNLGGAGSVAYLLSDGDAQNKAAITAELKRVADGYKKITQDESFGVCIKTGGFYWGSNSTIGDNAATCAIADYFMNTSAYEQTVRDNLSFILGGNHTGYCFVTKTGDLSPLKPHHRPSMALYCRFNLPPNPAPGFVVGGIVGNSYKDADDDYQSNEVCIYWNTPVSFAMAYIITLDKARVFIK